jgi:hypothetical protein
LKVVTNKKLKLGDELHFKLQAENIKEYQMQCNFNPVHVHAKGVVCKLIFDDSVGMDSFARVVSWSLSNTAQKNSHSPVRASSYFIVLLEIC